MPRGSRPRPDFVDAKPVYKYELKPADGEFLVVVKTFRGSVASDERGQARELAEGLAEYIRSECRLFAYVHESGWAMRQERAKEKAAVLENMKKYYAEKGITPTEEMLKVKMARIPDEYSVFVAPGKGSLKNMEEAQEFAKYVRKLKAPPADFCDAVMVGTDQDIARKQGEKINPFVTTTFAGRNPTLPKKALTVAERPKATELILSINAGKQYSLIHKTTKDFTLVVKVYGSSLGGKVPEAGRSGPG